MIDFYVRQVRHHRPDLPEAHVRHALEYLANGAGENALRAAADLLVWGGGREALAQAASYQVRVG